MGANLSNMEHGHTSAKSLSSHILTFHSTAKWKAYFDASKETNKLVRYYSFKDILFCNFILFL